MATNQPEPTPNRNKHKKLILAVAVIAVVVIAGVLTVAISQALPHQYTVQVLNGKYSSTDGNRIWYVNVPEGVTDPEVQCSYSLDNIGLTLKFYLNGSTLKIADALYTPDAIGEQKQLFTTNTTNKTGYGYLTPDNELSSGFTLPVQSSCQYYLILSELYVQNDPNLTEPFKYSGNLQIDLTLTYSK
jgi:hypothetical protein